MKKLLALILVVQYSFAQVSTLPHSIGIGQNTLSSIPFHINKNGEVARFQGTSPYVSFYDGINMNGYLQAINSTFEIGTKNFYDMNFYTGGASRININGTTGMATFYQKLIAQNGIKLTGPLQAQGESVGADGMVLVSKGNATPSWEETKLGFKVYKSAYEYSKSNTWDQLDTLSVKFNDGNMFDPLTGVFTAPSHGLYSFICRLDWAGCTSYFCNNVYFELRVVKNDGYSLPDEHFIQKLTNLSPNQNLHNFPFSIKLQAGDTIKFIYTFFDTEAGGHVYFTTISGHKIY